MKKTLEVVRKHHYVWAYYLRAWSAGSNKQIWHETSTGKISFDSVKGLSRELDFNKVHALSETDVAFIKLWPSGESPALQKFHQSQINYFKKATALINCHVGLESLNTYSELKNLSAAIQFGVFENTHTAIEILARPVLDELKLGNVGILEQGRYMTSFCNFLAQQLFRTKKVKEKSFEEVLSLPDSSKEVEVLKKLYARNWWLLSYKLALNFGYSLYSSAGEDHHTFIKNNTSTDFITSDCPVINIHHSANNISQGVMPESLDLYFPISPKFAYIISQEDKYNDLATSINEEAVRRLNIKMTEKSHLSIYGTSREAIEDARRAYQ